MSLQGKGFFIWKVRDCEGGNPAAIANAAQAAGFTHVLIKIADGPYTYNVDRNTNQDLVPPVVQALREKNMRVWGWHYVYGNNPIGEANIAIRRLQELGLEGYVIDAEAEYKQPGKANAASAYLTRLRSSLPNLPFALSSYRYPTYHPQLPWKTFLEKVDFNMPQVYWEQAHNPDAQLKRCVREFQALTPVRPVIPTGPAYTVGGWKPTEADIKSFLDTTRELKLNAVNFFSWDECKARVPYIWDTVSAYQWGAAPPPPADISDRWIAALNTRDPNKVIALYILDAVHITSARTIQGIEAIRAWYQNLFTQILPNATFTLTGFSGVGNSRHITWTAVSSAGKVSNGNDTIGMLDGKIAYHYSYFTITK